MAERLGAVMEVDYDEATALRNEFVRVRLNWNVNEPLKFQRKFNFAGVDCILSFRYEKLKIFCGDCGLMTHDTGECNDGPGDHDEHGDDGGDEDGPQHAVNVPTGPTVTPLSTEDAARIQDKAAGKRIVGSGSGGSGKRPRQELWLENYPVEKVIEVDQRSLAGNYENSRLPIIEELQEDEEESEEEEDPSEAEDDMDATQVGNVSGEEDYIPIDTEDDADTRVLSVSPINIPNTSIYPNFIPLEITTSGEVRVLSEAATGAPILAIRTRVLSPQETEQLNGLDVYNEVLNEDTSETEDETATDATMNWVAVETVLIS